MFKLVVTTVCVLLQAASALAAEEYGLAAPQQVRFHSENLRNTVLWTSGGGTTQGITYTVEYAIYGDSVQVEGTEQVVWRAVLQCREITNTECDVTEQTADLEEEYFARVRANRPQRQSPWAETASRFNPMMDTILGPPEMEIERKDKELRIKLKGPFRWRNGKKGRSLFRIIPSTVYNVTVYHEKTKKSKEYILVENNSLLLGPLEYESEHCVMAEAFSLSLPLKSMPSDWSCITMPEDPFPILVRKMMLGAVIPSALSLFALVVIGGLAYYYIYGHKQKLPKSTDMVHVDENHQTFKPENPLTIINVNLINATGLNIGESKLSHLNGFHQVMPPPAPVLLPELPSVGLSYATQKVQELVSSSPERQEEENTLSDDYGFLQREEIRDLEITRTEINQYMVQNKDREAEVKPYADQMDEAEEDEEEVMMQTFLNWDPETRVLKIPLLCQFSEDTTETKMETETEMETKPKVDTSLLQRRPVLTSVVVRQSSEEPAEEPTMDDVFSKMEKDWGLQIQISAD